MIFLAGSSLVACIVALTWFYWQRILPYAKKVNLTAIATMIRLSKVFVATLVAQNIGVSGHTMLLCNNLISELIAHSANALEKFRFSNESSTFSLLVNEDSGLEGGTLNPTFMVITNAVIRTATQSRVKLELCTSLIDGNRTLFVSSDIEIDVALKGKIIHVCGQKEDSSPGEKDSFQPHVSRWKISSREFESLVDLMNFLDGLHHEKKDTAEEIEQSFFWIPERVGGDVNTVYSNIAHVMLPYCHHAVTKFHRPLQLYGTQARLIHVTSVYGECEHTFSYDTYSIHVQKSLRNKEDCWKLTTTASIEVVESFLKGLEPKPKSLEEKYRYINLFRWEKPVVSQKKAQSSSKEKENVQNYTTSTRPPLQPTEVWEEYKFELGKKIEQYFLTKRVQEVVIDSLDASFKNEYQRNLLGVGLSANYLLEGEPGTGKTTLAYYFARVLNARYNRSVSVVQFDAAIFKSAEVFADATRQLNCKEMSDTTVVIIDEIDKLPFFRKYLASGIYESPDDDGDALNMGTFLMWLNTDTVRNKKSRFVFAMANDPNVLEKVNTHTNGALFRDGRFGTRVHVGGCDNKQFAEICSFVFPDENLRENETYQIVCALCEEHKNDAVSPLTVQRVQSLILRSNFCFNAFINATYSIFNEKSAAKGKDKMIKEE